MKQACIILATVLLLARGAAFAEHTYAGSVYGVYPEGVLVQHTGGGYLIPPTSATFQVGGVTVNYTDLPLGQPVQVVVPGQFVPRVVTVPDCNAWHVKYHPNHPHGGPPGQTGIHPQGGPPGQTDVHPGHQTNPGKSKGPKENSGKAKGKGKN
ncbi:MAG: hypothetical protein HY319_19965 [Armatimonadetes bacterium]|nr:hypothetical protein [Armatimonadota bacterium]